MSDVSSRLSTAPADRYRIERRLGDGGMATVYLAEDLKHDRNVTLKVLCPELAAVLGADRFVQEITIGIIGAWRPRSTTARSGFWSA